MHNPVFARLPPELLDLIVKEIQAHPASLASFARVNQACNRAATPCLFSRVRLRVFTPLGLQRDVQRLHTLLSRSAAFDHVRRLEGEGTLFPSLEDAMRDPR